MPLLTDAKNALALLRRGELRELLFRLRVRFSAIDLGYASVRELGLSPDNSHDYRHSGGICLEHVLDSLNITPDDAIVDFGAGKGGALITFARYPFSRIVGVELQPGLVKIAENNFRILGITGITLVTGDAAAFTDLDPYTFCYLYSPFPRPVVEAVMCNIIASLERAPRKVTIIYCNPEFHDAVLINGVFQKTAEFCHRHLDLPIHVYVNRP